MSHFFETIYYRTAGFILITMVSIFGFSFDAATQESSFGADSSWSAGESSAQQELMSAKQAMDAPSLGQDMPVLEPTKPAQKTTKKSVKIAESFVAPPDWEFDGFVVGGRDQNIKNMFAVNDLVYLTVGVELGFQSGDRLEVFRRGDYMKDPQTGNGVGYEVRKIAICEITNRIDVKTSSARVLRAYEPIEIGDLVKRAE